MSNIGTRIKQAREALGISQQELAERIDRDQSAISSYEAGRRRFPADDLPLFAEALEVPVMYFFEDLKTPDDLDHQILHVFNELPSVDAKRTAIQFVQLLGDVVNTN